RVPLFHADRLFQRLARTFGWAFTRRAQAVLVIPPLVGFWVLVFRWGDVSAALRACASVGFWILAALTALFVVNALRSITHGIACAHFGRQVGDLGLSFLYHVAPFVYVDWSDALWLKHSRERLWTIGAGLWIHAWIFGTALAVWWGTATGSS